MLSICMCKMSMQSGGLLGRSVKGKSAFSEGTVT